MPRQSADWLAMTWKILGYRRNNTERKNEFLTNPVMSCPWELPAGNGGILWQKKR